MSDETQTATGQPGESLCWCCGGTRSENALVRLGSHPEVGICLDCVHFLRRRALDHRATIMRRRLRDVAESIRGEVMRRELHQRPVIGPGLRWLNRHLPW